LLRFFLFKNINPLDPHSITQAHHAETLNQRRHRGRQWVLQLDPHLSDARLHSYFDVAEALLHYGSAGDYGQTQRLARDVRTAVVHSRGLTSAAPYTSGVRPLLQSLKDARDSSGLTAPPAPSAVIQALENARDYRPLAAGDPPLTAGNTPLTAGNTPLAANTARTPALASASTAGDTRTQALASASPVGNTRTPVLASASPAGDTRTPALASASPAGIAETPHPSQDGTPQGIPQDETPQGIPQDDSSRRYRRKLTCISR